MFMTAQIIVGDWLVVGHKTSCAKSDIAPFALPDRPDSRSMVMHIVSLLRGRNFDQGTFRSCWLDELVRDRGCDLTKRGN